MHNFIKLQCKCADYGLVLERTVLPKGNEDIRLYDPQIMGRDDGFCWFTSLDSVRKFGYPFDENGLFPRLIDLLKAIIFLKSGFSTDPDQESKSPIELNQENYSMPEFFDWLDKHLPPAYRDPKLQA